MNTKSVCKYSSEQGWEGKEPLNQGVEAKLKGFVQKGAEVYTKV